VVRGKGGSGLTRERSAELLLLTRCACAECLFLGLCCPSTWAIAQLRRGNAHQAGLQSIFSRLAVSGTGRQIRARSSSLYPSSRSAAGGTFDGPARLVRERDPAVHHEPSGGPGGARRGRLWATDPAVDPGEKGSPFPRGDPWARAALGVFFSRAAPRGSRALLAR
jgi:hypothetical protein